MGALKLHTEQNHTTLKVVYGGLHEQLKNVQRFISPDPLTKSFPWWTPFQFAGNTPIQAIDLDGKEIYFYTWDQTKQDRTALQKVHQIDVIEQKSDIVFLTDLFGWQTTQRANLRDLGIEQTWILHDNSWRLVPNNRLNQSLDKISKEEWGSFLTPEKINGTLQNIKSLGDKAGLAASIIGAVDGLRNLRKAATAGNTVTQSTKEITAPEGWITRSSKKGGGTVFQDPKNPHNSIRQMPGNTNSSNPAQQNPYVIFKKNGIAHDVNGNPLKSTTDPAAHIPLDKFDINKMPKLD